MKVEFYVRRVTVVEGPMETWGMPPAGGAAAGADGAGAAGADDTGALAFAEVTGAAPAPPPGFKVTVPEGPMDTWGMPPAGGATAGADGAGAAGAEATGADEAGALALAEVDGTALPAPTLVGAAPAPLPGFNVTVPEGPIETWGMPPWAGTEAAGADAAGLDEAGLDEAGALARRVVDAAGADALALVAAGAPFPGFITTVVVGLIDTCGMVPASCAGPEGAAAPTVTNIVVVDEKLGSAACDGRSVT